MRTFAAALALTVTLIAPAPALAVKDVQLAHMPAIMPRVVRPALTNPSLTIAYRYYHRSPACPGGVRVGRYYESRLPADERDRDRLAVGELGGCRIWIERSFSDTWDRPLYCQTIVHEVGHLLGLNHTTNQRSIMYPTLTPASMVLACLRFPLAPMPAIPARRARS